MTRFKRWTNARNVRFRLRVDLAREAIAGPAADASSARSQIDSQRQKIRMELLLFQSSFEIFDISLVGHRRKGKGRRARRFRGITGFAVDREHPFCTAIIRFELLVADGPGRRNAFFMFDFSDVLFSQPRKSGAIDLRIAADEVMNTGRKRLAVLVEPLLFWFVSGLGKDRLGTPVLRFGRKIIPSFQEKNLPTRIA